MKKLVAFLFYCFYCVNGLFAQEKPNIVVIISDDQAFQAIGAYGNKLIKTPGIDRIAKEGAIFQKAYVTNSLCGPSRASLLTGQYSHMNGFKDNTHSVFNHDRDSFAKRLQAAGYQTAWVGKQHLGNKPQSFDYYSILPGQGQYYNPDFIGMDGKMERVEGYVTNIITQKSEKWLDQRDRNKPFCIVIGHKATHRSWAPDTADFGKYDHIKFPIPANFYDTYKTRIAASQQTMSVSKDMTLGYDLKMNTPEQELKDGLLKRMNAAQKTAWKKYYDPIRAKFIKENLTGKALAEWKYQRYMSDYMNTAASLDRNINEVLNYLDKNNLTKNTIVIYLSDQGFYLGEHGWFDKRFMYEESFRTPFVMRYPGVIKPGTVNNDFVMNIDIAPTLLKAAGVAVPSTVQGESILPLFNAKTAKPREAIYYHYYEDRGEHNVSPQFGIKTARYKLIRYYDQVSGWELFDLKKDPKEMENIYEKQENRGLISTLKKQLATLIDKYKDDEAKALL
ncbi:sulfatase family protein [Pedobacter endophyticus]|uniref:Sulfatase n=1 Tax=Pedobacter endophyticus TaxID=2789740 RepID=A0A7S9L2A6_9SPHI|nr:sulfatase [Pedobacter endophyticus]QPH41175.1 sulfatase [Pedobacter endophyticus]